MEIKAVTSLLQSLISLKVLCPHTGGSGNGHQDLAMCDLVLSALPMPTVPRPTMPTMPCFAVVTSTDFLEYKREQWQGFLAPCAVRTFFKENHYKNKCHLRTPTHRKSHFRFKKCSGV